MVHKWTSTQHWRNDPDWGRRSTWRKTCRSATLCKKNSTSTDLALNTGLHVKRPATDSQKKQRNPFSIAGHRRENWTGTSQIRRESLQYRWFISVLAIDPPVTWCILSHCTHRTNSAPDQTGSLHGNLITPSVYAVSSPSLALYLATVMLAVYKRPGLW